MSQPTFNSHTGPAKKRTQHWIFTINNYTASSTPVFDEKVHDYMILGREVGEKGTPHIQGYVKFKIMKRFQTVKKLFPLAHIEPMYSTPDACIKYCQKEGDFDEFGVVPETRKSAASKKMKRNWEDAWQAAKEGRIEDIPTSMRFQYYSAIKRIRQDYPDTPNDLEDPCGLWFYGPSGVGKSHTARARYPDHYDKPLNKWWDGYRNQKTILLDDVDHTHAKWIGHHLKRWADRYSFPAEQKGTTIQIRPERIIVTSQYTIDELFQEDAALVTALKRRFIVETIKRPERVVEPRRIIREKYCDICRSDPCNCFAEDHNNKHYI